MDKMNKKMQAGMMIKMKTKSGGMRYFEVIAVNADGSFTGRECNAPFVMQRTGTHFITNKLRTFAAR